MSEDEKIEYLERLGYTGQRLSLMLSYLSEYTRRKTILEDSNLTKSDIVAASLIFDACITNRKVR